MVRKILIGLGILILLILAAAVILPIVYKDRIVAMVKTEVNKNINAKVDFGDFDLTILSSFPDFTLKMQKLTVIGINEFKSDTLIAAKELGIAVNIMSVIRGGQIDINRVYLDQPNVNLIVLKDGKANWDISKPDTTPAQASEPSQFKAALKEYSIDNGYISYDDASMGFVMTMTGLNHKGSGDFTQDLFTLRTNTTADATDLWYGGVKYLHRVRTALKANLDMDMPNMKFTFKENEISLNELMLGFDGFVAMPGDDITMDLKFDAKKNDFRNFVSMIPGVYREGFKDLKSGGTLALKGFVKGTYNEKQMPGFGLAVKVQNGNFKYPSLPVAVNNVQLDLNIENPDGVPDHTAIDLNKLHTELGTEPFDAKLRVRTPVSDAQIEGMVKGRVNFANISKIIPLEEGTSLRGLLNTDLAFSGRMSAIEQKKYENFKAAGVLALSDFNYSSKDYKQGFDLQQCNLTFNPQNITLNTFKAKMGSSDFDMTGTLDNFLAYFFKKEVLKGTLNLRSNKINLADFNSGSEEAKPAAADTASGTLAEVPANVDFVLNTAISQLIYENVNITVVSGNVTVRDQSLNMNNLSMNMLDGNLKMSGTYATRERKSADMNLKLDVTGFDVQQTVKAFATVKKLAPIAERATGKYSTSFTLNGKLDEHMNPVLQTLNGGGKLTTQGVVVSNFPPLVKLSDALKMDQFKQLPVSNVNLSFKFENGRVSVAPFDVNLLGIATTVSGSTGFDQTLDYNFAMNMPVSKLPSQATGAINNLISQANSKGANFSMAENVKLNVKMGGTVTNPTVNPGIKETTGGVVNSLKDQAKAELDKKKAEAEQKIREEADKLKNQAQDKAKAEADKLKKEAEAKAAAEKERLRKEAEKKAKEGLNGLFKK